jgi:quercetin dioxygenase-like cupin family protein
MDQRRDTSCGEGPRLELAGQGITYRIVGEETGGSLALVESTLPPGHLGAPPHMHRNEDQVVCVLEGELMVQVGERIIHARTGCVVFKPRGVFHAFWNPGATTARYLDFITPAGFEECLQELARLLPAAGPADMLQVRALAERYQVEFDPIRLSELLEQHEVSAPGLWSAFLPSTSPSECGPVHRQVRPVPVG